MPEKFLKEVHHECTKIRMYRKMCLHAHIHVSALHYEVIG